MILKLFKGFEDENGSIIKESDNAIIILENGGQLDYGRNKDMAYTSYNALQRAFKTIGHFMSINKDYSLFIPYNIGCGLANGDWGVVVNLINQEFSRFDERVKIVRL